MPPPMAVGDHLNVSMALACIWAWLVPQFYSEFAEFTSYRIALQKQRQRRQKRQNVRSQSSSSPQSKRTERATNDSSKHKIRQHQKGTNQSTFPRSSTSLTSSTSMSVWSVTKTKSQRNNQQQQHGERNMSDPIEQRNEDRHNQQDQKSSSINNIECNCDVDYDSSTSSSSMTTTANAAALRATASGTFIATCIIVIVYSLSALAIGTVTHGLDDRAYAVIVGTGRIFSSILFVYFSIHIPEWLHVVETPQTKHYYRRMVDVPTLYQLRTRVILTLLGRFMVMYPIMLLYFCGTQADDTVAVVVKSTGIGVLSGLVVVLLIGFGRCKKFLKFKFVVAVVGSSLVCVGSALAFSFGCYFIWQVWYEKDYIGWYGLAAFVGWLCFAIAVNIIHYRITKYQVQRQKDVAKVIRAQQVPTAKCACEIVKEEREKKGIDVNQPTDLEVERIDGNEGTIEYRQDETTMDEGFEISMSPSTRVIESFDPEGSIISRTPDPRASDDGSENADMDFSDDESSETNSFYEERNTIEKISSKRNYSNNGSTLHLAPTSFVERLATVAKWICWAATSGFHLYLCVVSVGATTQQNVVRAQLNSTFDLLYPSNYNSGPMCAWDVASPDASIQTFDTIQDVYDANYTVIHCGECGSCSNWNDLRLQYTTRKVLASKGQKCAKKSLFGGTADDVQQCNEDLIGFTEDCSLCWTEDQLCARNNCVFIYLQALIINQVGNFAVGFDTITSATCDEALCGPEFVPCSGATRRRMNIKSSIPRPSSQQCTVARENWMTIFNEEA